MHDPLNAIRRLYGEPGEGPPAEGVELKAMADLKAALDRLPPHRPDPSVIDAVVAAAGDAARSAALAPLRSVYGEETVELDAAAESEARALAGMKAALDALPPRRPEASVVDAVVEAAGEAARAAALAPVRAVYEEEPEPLASEAAEAEATALADLKAALDRLPPHRPDASVIDAVVAAAARPAAERPATVAAVTGRAADRPVRRDTRRRVAAVLGAVFAVVLVFGGGLWLNQEAPNSQEAAVADRSGVEEQVAEAAPAVDGQAESTPAASLPEAAPAVPPAEVEQLAAASRPRPTARSEVPARRVEPAAPPAGDAPAGSPESFARAAAPAPVLEDLGLEDLDLAEGLSLTDAEGLSLAEAGSLSLDGDDELRLLYLRLREMQAAQAGLGWDAPPVSLGAAPDSAPAQPATGWMQVRVQR